MSSALVGEFDFLRKFLSRKNRAEIDAARWLRVQGGLGNDRRTDTGYAEIDIDLISVCNRYSQLIGKVDTIVNVDLNQGCK